MIKEALAYLKNEFKKTEFYEVGKETYANENLKKIEEPVRKEVTVYSLSGLVDFIKDNFDNDKRLLVSVLNQQKIVVETQLNNNKKREIVIISLAYTPTICLDQFMSLEAFNIQLQSIFVKNDDVKNLLRILGNLRSSNIRNAGDNGVSQIVETKRGVTMAQEEVVPNPVRLKPFRTFTEIEQPESLFVFRLRESGNEIQAGLFEADGGAWKNVARLSIKDYLIENLKEQIENNSILIIG
ncbi:hypothetical protein JL773_01750 [Staphylococcus pseudintermedius]|uniref:hypothetical protein n=2 Tax=Staphylococcus pseudintermedius TaxID=283734 RepID=UPI001BDF3673|nr:hypothetical protein [Staphylococcus pseudintermedius]EJF1310956.1 hypothetical protein [Staphylococcus pseudintermedius]EJL7989674.1 hypothetical protein [Staphylococcus pseudintermedius]MCE5796172.1 hypothetical protein [Staphylococcus pseudintermedius]MDT0902741.1 hypothetical protein [Staphylococcus pseudintermedius]HCA7835470.1 hypothetical protein [Staphylococcus pseudintermedius]